MVLSVNPHAAPAVSSVRLQDSSAPAAASSTPAPDAPVRAASIVLTAAGPDRPGIVHEGQ